MFRQATRRSKGGSEEQEVMVAGALHWLLCWYTFPAAMRAAGSIPPRYRCGRLFGALASLVSSPRSMDLSGLGGAASVSLAPLAKY